MKREQKAPALPRALPWTDYALRFVFSGLLALVAYQLLSQSTFAWRMRDDVPLGPLTGALALFLALVPLAAGRGYVKAYLGSAFVASAIGGYWWTRIPWEEVITQTNFNVHDPAGFWDYALVASPFFLAVAYVALSRWSALRADLLARGAERAQADRAAAASFLAGGAALVVTTLSGAAVIAALATGVLAQGVPGVRGPLAVMLALLAALAAVLLLANPTRVTSTSPTPLKRPSSREAGRAGRERTRARKSPS